MERLRTPTTPAAVGLPDPFLRRQPDHFPHHLRLLTYTHTRTASSTIPSTAGVVSALPPPLQSIRTPVLFKFPPLPSVTTGIDQLEI